MEMIKLEKKYSIWMLYKNLIKGLNKKQKKTLFKSMDETSMKKGDNHLSIGFKVIHSKLNETINVYDTCGEKIQFKRIK